MHSAEFFELVSWTKELVKKCFKQYDVYSTEERKIGTWIDGKPLYRKVIETTSPSEVGTIKNIDISSLNADYVCVDASHSALCIFNDNTETEPFRGGEQIKAWYDKTYGCRLSIGSRTDMVDKKILLVIEYTKTTD